MPSGVITKLVRTSPPAPPCPSQVPGMEDVEGYGMIRGHDGREFFFLHSVVQGGRFGELRQGQLVEFSLEAAPLDRSAAVVQVAQAEKTGV